MSVKLPDLVVPLRVPQLMAYGAATWDWHQIHYDSAAARASGMPGPVVDGQMFGALIARQIRKWAGPRAHFVELRFRNCGFVTAPNEVVVKSELSSSRICGSVERFEVATKIFDNADRVVVDEGLTVIEVPR
jgi:acyl dehydratase